MEIERARTREVAGSGDAGLARRAAAVLSANDAGGYTVPARSTYPHQWNWDSALASLGWAELDPGRAFTELERLAGARDALGMLPHIAFAPPAPQRRYEPGPDRWGERVGADGRRISGITQPPLAATCLRLLFERHPDEPRARALLAPLHAWHRFLLRERDPHGMGEPVLIHPWESGRDNAAEWDVPLARVAAGPGRRPPRRDTDHVHAAERPSDEHYRRFLALVRAGAAARWPQERLAREGAFRVLDPGFSAILARAALDLAWLAERLGEARIAAESGAAAERVGEALRARADADGLIRAVDLIADAPLPVTGAGSALALLGPELGEARVEAARRLVCEGALSSPYGVRSLARHHAECSERNYWRGPVWANVTWLAALGLEGHGEAAAAAELRRRMLAAAGRGGMREYFAPGSGRGLGSRDFSWTAALCLREAT